MSQKSFKQMTHLISTMILSDPPSDFTHSLPPTCTNLCHRYIHTDTKRWPDYFVMSPQETQDLLDLILRWHRQLRSIERGQWVRLFKSGMGDRKNSWKCVLGRADDLHNERQWRLPRRRAKDLLVLRLIRFKLIAAPFVSYMLQKHPYKIVLM